MRIVVAPDKFAGTLSAIEAAEIIARGWHRRAPRDELLVRPVADGGVGTVATLAVALKSTPLVARTGDPLGRPVDAHYLVVDGGKTAIVEAAEACGLHLLAPAERDPRRAGTAGVGEVLRAALASGVRRIVVGLGGSATNDGGAGLAQALGVRLLDETGAELPPGGAALARLDRVDASGLDPRLAGVEVVLASDVDNPLCGPQGASAVFGPQKGADAEAVAELDAALARWAEVLERDVPGGAGVAGRPGSGAAGGLGAALMAFCGASVRSGVDLVIELTGLARDVARADLVVTGEGCFDRQSLLGKAPLGVARIAQREGAPCLLLAGQVEVSRRELGAAGIDAAYAVADLAGSVDEALAAPDAWLEELAARVAGEWSRG